MWHRPSWKDPPAATIVYAEVEVGLGGLRLRGRFRLPIGAKDAGCRAEMVLQGSPLVTGGTPPGCTALTLADLCNCNRPSTTKGAS